MKKNKSRKRPGRLLDTVIFLIMGAVTALMISNFAIVNTVVISSSMRDAMTPGDRLVFNRLAYLTSDPERYDIVIFRLADGDSQNYIKRVIGLPGETVEIIDGKVYIDGGSEPLRDDFTHDPADGGYGPYPVPEGHYFMLGDNRASSNDSRFWPEPYVARGGIMGKALFRYYPYLGMIEPDSHKKLGGWAFVGITVALLFAVLILWAVIPRKGDELISVEEYRRRQGR